MDDIIKTLYEQTKLNDPQVAVNLLMNAKKLVRVAVESRTNSYQITNLARSVLAALGHNYSYVETLLLLLLFHQWCCQPTNWMRNDDEMQYWSHKPITSLLERGQIIRSDDGWGYQLTCETAAMLKRAWGHYPLLIDNDAVPVETPMGDIAARDTF